MSYKILTFLVYFTFIVFSRDIKAYGKRFKDIKKPIIYGAAGVGAIFLATVGLVIYLRKAKNQNNQNKDNNNNNNNPINNNDPIAIKVVKSQYNEGEISDKIFEIGKTLQENNNKKIVEIYNSINEKISLSCKDIVTLIDDIKQKLNGEFIAEITFDKLYQANFVQYPFNDNDQKSLKEKFDKKCGFLSELIKKKLDFFLYYFSDQYLGQKVKHTLMEKLEDIHNTIELKIRHNCNNLKNKINCIFTAINFNIMYMGEKEKDIFKENIFKKNIQEINKLIEKFPEQVRGDLKVDLIKDIVNLKKIVNDNLEAIYKYEFNQELSNITNEIQNFLDKNKKIKNVLRAGNIKNFNEITLNEEINLIIFKDIKNIYQDALKNLDHDTSEKLSEKFELNVNKPLKTYNLNGAFTNQKEIIIDDNKTIILYQVDWAKIAEDSEIFGNFNRFLLLEDLHISKKFGNDYNRIMLLKIFFYLKNMPEKLYKQHFESNVKLFFEKNPCIFTKWFLNLKYAFQWQDYQDFLLITLCGEYQNKSFQDIVNNYINNNIKKIYQNYYSYSYQGDVFEFYTQKSLYKATDVQSILYYNIFQNDKAEFQQHVLNNDNKSKIGIEQNFNIENAEEIGQEIINVSSYKEIERLKLCFRLPKIYYKEYRGCGCCSINSLEGILADMLRHKDEQFRQWLANRAIEK